MENGESYQETRVRKHDTALVLGILSIVFLFICQIAGLIMGIIGLRKSDRKDGSDTAWVLNVIGVVLNSVIIFLIVVAIIIMVIAFSGFAGYAHMYHMW